MDPARAVRAAATVAARLGIRGDVEVVATRANAIVRVGDVVARVALLTARVRDDPAAWLAREIAVSRAAAARGAPVLAPRDEAGPFEEDGCAIALWPYLPPAPAIAIDDAAAQLRALHLGLADAPGDPPRTPLDELPAVIARAGAPELLPHVERVARALAAVDGPRQPLHGDAHPGNLIGARWIDLEDTWCGPVAWDLACLIRRTPERQGELLARYGAPAPGLDVCVEARELQGAAWLALLAQDDATYAPRATAALARWHGDRDTVSASRRG